MKVFFLALELIFAAFLFSGCSTLFTSDLPDSFLKAPSQGQLVSKKNPPLLVSITYPATFDPKALAVVKRAHQRAPVVGAQRRFDPRAFDDALVKTAFDLFFS